MLRDLNRDAALRFAFGTGEFTATEAMRATGLTRATVLAVCAELTAAGWLTELDDSRVAGLTSLGRPARRYQLNATAGLVVGVDAAERAIRVLVADLRGHELASRTVAVDPAVVDGPGRLEQVDLLVAAALADAGCTREQVLLTVVGVPAPVDKHGRSPVGRGTYWPVMNPGYVDHLAGEVVVENDANLAALAEHAHHDIGNLAVLLMGERVGAGLIVDGELLRGRRGGAGELRLMDVVIDADLGLGLPSTGGFGMLARDLARAWLTGTDEPSRLREAPLDQVEAAAVLQAARDGDPLAGRVVDRLGDRLARIAVVLESLLDVEQVVVAGDVAGIIGPVLDRARTVLHQEFEPPFPELVPSGLGDDVVVRGAVQDATRRIRELPSLRLPLAERA